MEWVDSVFPNGILVDTVMWLSIPFWVYTLYAPTKNKLYWIFSIVVCIQWCIFDYYIKAWHGCVLNFICLIALIMGYKKFRNNKLCPKNN